MARTLLFEKKLEEALDYYRQVIEVEPDHDSAIEEGGWCHFELKQYQEAQE